MSENEVPAGSNPEDGDETPQESEARRAAKENDDTAASFAPIGIVFFSVGIALFANEDTRATAWAFMPIGVTFLILGLDASTKKRQRDEAAGSAEGDDAASSDGSERP